MSALPIKIDPRRQAYMRSVGRATTPTAELVSRHTIPKVAVDFNDLCHWRRYLHGALDRRTWASRWNLLVLADMRRWSLADMLAFDESILVGSLIPSDSWTGTAGSGFSSTPNYDGQQNGSSGGLGDADAEIKIYNVPNDIVMEGEEYVFRVGAFHPGGIARVEFYCENDIAVSVSGMSAEPGTNIPTYRASFRPRDTTGHMRVYVVAVPTNGKKTQIGPFTLLVEHEAVAADQTYPVRPFFASRSLGATSNTGRDNVGFSISDGEYDADTRELTTSGGSFSNASDAGDEPRFVYFSSGTGLASNNQGPFLIQSYNSTTSVTLAPQDVQSKLDWRPVLPTSDLTTGDLTTPNGPSLSYARAFDTARAQLGGSTENIRIYLDSSDSHFIRESATGAPVDLTSAYFGRVEKCPSGGIASIELDPSDVKISVNEGSGNWIVGHPKVMFRGITNDDTHLLVKSSAGDIAVVDCVVNDSDWSGDPSIDVFIREFGVRNTGTGQRYVDRCTIQDIQESTTGGAAWVYGTVIDGWQVDAVPDITYVYGCIARNNWKPASLPTHSDFVQTRRPGTSGDIDGSQICFNQVWDHTTKFLLVRGDETPVNTTGVWRKNAIVGNLYDNTYTGRGVNGSQVAVVMVDHLYAHNTFLNTLSFQDDTGSGRAATTATRVVANHNVFYGVGDTTAAGVVANDFIGDGNHFMNTPTFGTNATSGGSDSTLFVDVGTGVYKAEVGGDLDGAVAGVSDITFPDFSSTPILVGGDIGAIQPSSLVSASSYNSGDTAAELEPLRFLLAPMGTERPVLEVDTVYYTEIAASTQKREQRSQMLSRPYRRVDMAAFTTGPHAGVIAQSLLRLMATRRFEAPLFVDWSVLTSGASSGQPIISCDTTNRRFFVGQRVAVFTPTWEGEELAFETGTIYALTSTSIELDADLSNVWTTSDYVVPLIECEMLPNTRARSVWNHDDVVLYLKAIEKVGVSALPPLVTPGTVPPGYSTYSPFPGLTLPVLDIEQMKTKNGRAFGWDSDSVITSMGRGGTVPHLFGDRPGMYESFDAEFASRSDAFSYLGFFDSRAGACYPFFMSSASIRYNVTAIPSASEISVEAVYPAYSLYPDFVGIVDTSGVLSIRRVSSVTFTSPTVHTLNLDAPVSGMTLSNVYSVRPAGMFRYARDYNSERWVTPDLMRCGVEAIEVDAETAISEITDFVSRTTAPASQQFNPASCGETLTIKIGCVSRLFESAGSTTTDAYIGAGEYADFKDGAELANFKLSLEKACEGYFDIEWYSYDIDTGGGGLKEQMEADGIHVFFWSRDFGTRDDVNGAVNLTAAEVREIGDWLSAGNGGLIAWTDQTNTTTPVEDGNNRLLWTDFVLETTDTATAGETDNIADVASTQGNPPNPHAYLEPNDSVGGVDSDLDVMIVSGSSLATGLLYEIGGAILTVGAGGTLATDPGYIGESDDSGAVHTIEKIITYDSPTSGASPATARQMAFFAAEGEYNKDNVSTGGPFLVIGSTSWILNAGTRNGRVSVSTDADGDPVGVVYDHTRLIANFLEYIRQWLGIT